MTSTFDFLVMLSWLPFPETNMVQFPTSLPETVFLLPQHRDVISFEPMIQFSGARC